MEKNTAAVPHAAIIAQEFLRWNRSLDKPVVEVTKELFVAKKVLELAASHPAPQAAAEGDVSELRKELGYALSAASHEAENANAWHRKCIALEAALAATERPAIPAQGQSEETVTITQKALAARSPVAAPDAEAIRSAALEEALQALILGCPRSSQPKAWEAHSKAIASVKAALPQPSHPVKSAESTGGAA